MIAGEVGGGEDRAVFLDKDGTLIHDVPYNADPDRLELAPGAGHALRSLRGAGFRLVVVSNQSGVARGLFPETALGDVEGRLRALLAADGVELDGFYYCPHHPEGSVRGYARRCHCRKPAPGLLIRAGRDLGLDLERSWIVGDILDDVAAGHRAGCRAVLLDIGHETEWIHGDGRHPDAVATDLVEAAELILAGDAEQAEPRPPALVAKSGGAHGGLVARFPEVSLPSPAARRRSPRPERPDPVRVGVWHEARRILCVRLDTIGDLLMTTPAIRAVKATPGRRVSLLTSASGATAGRLVPEVDEVIEYAAPWMKHASERSDPTGIGDAAMIARLRDGRFDAAVIFTVYSQSPLPAAFLTHLAGIPLRLAHAIENPYGLLTDWVPDPEPDIVVRHEVRRQLDLVGQVGMGSPADARMSLVVSDAARVRAAETLSRAGLSLDRPWLVIHPGATAPSRRYPPEGFAEVARRLVSEVGYQVAFTGLADEEGLIAHIRALMAVPSVSLAGLLDLEALAAVLEGAGVLVAGNSGPVHVAAAVGTPVVDVYALTNPQHTPWGVPSRVLFHDVPCRYCYRSICPEGHHDCLRGVSPERVFVAACELLEETRDGASLRSPWRSAAPSAS